MGGLGHLFYPWGIIVQGIALWHFVKRRPEGYWLWIIIFGGVLGAGVYVFAEMIPDLGLLRRTVQGLGDGRGSQSSRIKFWTIRRREIWKSWQNCILSGRTVRKRGVC